MARPKAPVSPLDWVSDLEALSTLVHGAMPEDARRERLLALLASLSEHGRAFLSCIKQLEHDIGQLTFASDATRTLMLTDLARLAIETSSDVRESIMNRLYKGLVSKAPDPPAPVPQPGAATIGGHVLEMPARFG